MQQAVVKPGWDRENQDLLAALPLYAASLVVTLAGIGAVGVTISLTSWTPVWVFLTILGHGASLWFRKLRLPAELVFYPVMAAGLLLIVSLVTTGNAMLGVEQPLLAMPTDMGTATLVGCLAVIRTFTLVTNGTLLFSPVPAITMLALVGSTNPNAEVPLFFGLLVLGALFTSGYESHLKRAAVVRRQPGAILSHLMIAWFVTLGVSLAALLFPVVVRPVMGPLSPYSIPGVQKLNNLIDFTKSQNGQVPVGQGPIQLSPAPLYEVYTQGSGRHLRTDVLTTYSGKSWSGERQPVVVEMPHVERVEGPMEGPLPQGAIIPRVRYRFELPPDPERPRDVPVEEIRQLFVTQGYSSEGVPAFGRIRRIQYPRQTIYAHASGIVSGNGHLTPDKVFEVVSELPQFPTESLRAAPPVKRESFDEPETLELPQSTYPVQVLARSLAKSVESPYDRVRTFIEYIEKNCRYTLEEAVTPSGEDAAAYYLFKTKRGACDLSATALAVMCRAVGIPARVAIGYLADEPLPQGGGFLIRQHHAHMWVEAYFAGYGWVPFDASPALIDIRNNPFELAFYRLQRMVSRIGGGGLDALLFLVVLLLTLAMLAYTGWRRLMRWMERRSRHRKLISSSPAAAVGEVYGRAMRLLERRGWRREAWMTSREYQESVREAWKAFPEAWEALGALSGSYSQARYAGEATAQDLRAAEEALRKLARAAPGRRAVERKAGAGKPSSRTLAAARDAS